MVTTKTITRTLALPLLVSCIISRPQGFHLYNRYNKSNGGCFIPSVIEEIKGHNEIKSCSDN